MAKFSFKVNVANVAHIVNGQVALWYQPNLSIFGALISLKGLRCNPLMKHLPNILLSRFSGFYFPEEENCCLCGVKSNGVSIILALCRGLVS